MSRKRQRTQDDPGQDSFLDIVANLVGILIILVMVAGARAKDALIQSAATAPPTARPSVQPSEAPEPAATDPGPSVAEVEQAKQAAGDVESDIQSIDARIKHQLLEIERRRLERNQIHLLMTAVEQKLNERRGGLDTSRRQEFDAKREILSTRAELDKLKQTQQAILNSRAPVTKLAHLPTPMVKTVFGKEIHFRLLGGRLAYVPWDEMIERFRAEAPQKIWKLKDSDAITETIGPIRDFILRYTIRRRKIVVATGHGGAIRERIEPEKLELTATREDIGEPLEHALSAGSQFDHMLRAEDPKRTTITVWVYPDGFHQFRTLKKELYRRGFLTASRPMPEGHPIGASPQGSRSTAQ